MTEAIVDHARLFLALGMSVLPLHYPVPRNGRLQCSCGKPECRQAAKHPFGRLVPRGLLDASNDAATVEHWFANKSYNIGIATGGASGIVVLDVDPRHDGHLALAALEVRYGPLPLTWRFLTGGGGEHILFRHPGGKVANSAGALGRGLDVRGDGGYIVAPPSTHIFGRPYAVLADHHPDDLPLADPPPWLVEPKTGPSRSKRGLVPKRRDWRAHVCGVHAEGKRNDAIARLAGHLLRARVDPRVCLSLIISWNRLHCQPPLDEDEVVLTIRSIAAREIARRGGCHAG